MKTIHETKETPVVAECDVLVAGGGPAGMAAAVAAARHGAKTILIERYGYLGGMATGGIVCFLGDMFDGNGKRCIGGIAQELIENVGKLGGLSGGGLHVDSELLKIAADRILFGSGVIFRLHSWIVDAVMEDDRVVGVITESKSGRQAILAKVCVDATGDGDVAAFAGAEFELHNMRIALNFKVGGVSQDREISPPIPDIYGCPMILGDTPHDGVFWVNDRGLSDRGNTRTIGLDGSLNGIDVKDLTFAETETRKGILAGITYYRDNVDGYENVHLLAIASQIGVRDSRRIKSLHRLTTKEMNEDKWFGGTIGLTGMTFPKGNHLEVLYRTLVPEKVDGLLMAGRCIDVDDGLIHSIRVIPPCMMTGQAAGTAAAISAENDEHPRQLLADNLRSRLREDGVILEL